MRVGLDLTQEKLFLEMNAGNGLTTTATLTAIAARAIAAQLIANAEALDVAMEQGLLGNEDDG